jgi:hypothetical protein
MTARPQMAFVVEESRSGPPFTVVGRCGDQPVRVGGVFTVACRYQSRRSVEDFSHTPQLLDSRPVALTVVAVEAYHRQLDELGPGMTGQLVLAGDGQEGLESGTILEGPAAVPAPA